LSLGKGYVSSICKDYEPLGTEVFSPIFLVLKTNKTIDEIKYLLDSFYSATIDEKDSNGNYVPKFLYKRKWKIDIENDIDSALIAEALESETIVPIEIDVSKFKEDLE